MPRSEWQIGSYVVDDPAGFDHGNFGTLYHARHVDGRTSAALKLVRFTDADAEDSRERIAAERRGALLQQQFERAHGLVPKVYEFGEFRNHFYIAMEFVDGESLARRIAGRSLTTDAAVGLAVSICDFLDKAHRFETVIEGKSYKRIVHADLKPAHVLIPNPGEMKVLDFGIAKALETASLGTTINWSTPHYASPERLNLDQANEHADFWSLGVILYEMVSGHRPYSKLEAHDTRDYRHLRRAIASNMPREPLPAACPPGLAAIINKLLALQPEHRYQTAAGIRSDLELVAAGCDPAALKAYATPATLPVARDRVLRAAPTERGAAGAALSVVPATDPLPSAAAVEAGGSIAPLAPAPRAAYARLRGVAARGLWLVAMLALVAAVTTEGVAWMRAEGFREQVATVDLPTVAVLKARYDRIEGWGLLDVGLRARVNSPLAKRLVGLVDAAIADYRTERPAMRGLDWRQANEAAQWALRLSSGDRRIRSRALLTEGHLARFAARAHPRGGQKSREAYRAALEKFRAAAAADDRSYDPYVAMSGIQIYGLDDIEGAIAALAAAEKRGFVLGRRERALLGDGYLRRANRSRTTAQALTGESRRRLLENARGDYQSCITAFDPIVDFANAAANLELCKRLQERVDVELEPDPSEVQGS